MAEKKEIEVRKLNLSTEKEREDLINSIQSFMGQYSDPLEHVREVVEYNREEAEAFEAVDEKGERIAIAFLIKTPYRLFQPKYHLAYIAVDIKSRGLGVGEKLLKKIHEFTNGQYSLHVNPENTEAINFYESMGLKKAYMRMTPN